MSPRQAGGVALGGLASPRIPLEVLAILLASLSLGPRTAAGAAVAPFSLGGEVGYELRSRRFERGADSDSRLASLRLDAAGYLWEPWFALFNASLGLTEERRDDAAGESGSDFTTGSLRLSLFPISRFPLEIYYDKTDSRLRGELGGEGFRGERAGLLQHYTTRDGTRMSLRAERNRHSGDRGRDRLDSAQFTAQRSFEEHELSLDAGGRELRRDDGGEERNDTLLLRHSYRPAASLSVEDVLSHSRSASQLDDGEQRFDFNQLSTTLFWRPGDARDLLFTASARAVQLARRDALGTQRSETFNANAGIDYQWTPHSDVFANAALAYAGNGEARVNHSQSAGINYRPTSRPLGEFDYDWFAGSSLSNRGGDDGAGQTLSARLGHGLSRVLPLAGEPASRLTFDAGQSLGGSQDSESGGSASLSHSAALGWSRQAAGASSLLRLSLADSRRVAGGDAGFQLVNLQANENLRLSRAASFSGNLTVQRNRQFGGVADGRWKTASSAAASYRHLRALGVRGLRFHSRLTLISDALLPLLDEPAEVGGRESLSWLNRFDYTIGLLDLVLLFNHTRENDVASNLLLFRATRRFGN